MPSIEAAGASLFYSAEGEGVPLVLLHGTTSGSEDWTILSRYLSRHWKVVVPDMPGYSGSQQPAMTNGLRSEVCALAVLDLINHLGGRAHVVGHSTGGAIAMRLAFGAPECMVSLCVIDPASFHLLRAGSRADRVLFDEIQHLSSIISVSLLNGNIANGAGRFVDYWNEAGMWSLMRSCQRIRATQRMDRVVDDLSAEVSEHWPVEVCHALDVPVLALTGKQSPKPAQRVTEIIAEAVPGAQVRMIAEGGHMAIATHPAIINAVICEFMSESGKRDADRQDCPRCVA